ncbi:ABC transporter transmembrane domain-containing protein [Desulfosporosinus metallidurans]|uniref:ABC transporter transmembrane domain-containing protein n=1 Tax=Desulfosporosinus metallidurans TaxID=1888891 RepID=UPI00094D48C9
MNIVKKQNLLLVKKVSKYIKPYTLKLILLFLCILCGILFSLVQPLLWGEIITDLFKKDINSVYTNIKYVLMASIANSIVNFIQSYLFNFSTTNIVYDLKTDMYNKILDFPIKVYLTKLV